MSLLQLFLLCVIIAPVFCKALSKFDMLCKVFLLGMVIVPAYGSLVTVANAQCSLGARSGGMIGRGVQRRQSRRSARRSSRSIRRSQAHAGMSGCSGRANSGCSGKAHSGCSGARVHAGCAGSTMGNSHGQMHSNAATVQDWQPANVSANYPVPELAPAPVISPEPVRRYETTPVRTEFPAPPAELLSWCQEQKTKTKKPEVNETACLTDKYGRVLA